MRRAFEGNRETTDFGCAAARHDFAIRATIDTVDGVQPGRAKMFFPTGRDDDFFRAEHARILFAARVKSMFFSEFLRKKFVSPMRLS